jgi:hypothetical protein
MDDGSDNMPVKEHDLTRAAVILHIESKRKTFVTMRRSPANATQWVIGENIRVRTSAGGKKYLRTDANNIDADNLNNLPEF